MQKPIDSTTQEAGEKLPTIRMEQEVMEAVMLHDVVVLCGETGYGKTTPPLAQNMSHATYLAHALCVFCIPGMIAYVTMRSCLPLPL